MAQAPRGRKRKADGERPVVASASTRQEELSLLEQYERDQPGPSNTLQWVCSHTHRWLDAPTSADEALHYALGKLAALAYEVDRNQGLLNIPAAKEIYAQSVERLDEAARQFATAYERSLEAEVKKVVL